MPWNKLADKTLSARNVFLSSFGDPKQPRRGFMGWAIDLVPNTWRLDYGTNEPVAGYVANFDLAMSASRSNCARRS